ncbi:hypothetical protein X743_30030 [Mesorhizobium sp. LNHC252B00]|nr:hypothetical protein X743_30030 [Mesorhizobium sp. LNHC252B00]
MSAERRELGGIVMLSARVGREIGRAALASVARIKLRWPSCKAPIVGTTATFRPF